MFPYFFVEGAVGKVEAFTVLVGKLDTDWNLSPSVNVPGVSVTSFLEDGYLCWRWFSGAALSL